MKLQGILSHTQNKQNMVKWYPIKFEPILKDKIWGGNKLQTLLGKNLSSDTIGEMYRNNHNNWTGD